MSKFKHGDKVRIVSTVYKIVENDTSVQGIGEEFVLDKYNCIFDWQGDMFIANKNYNKKHEPELHQTHYMYFDDELELVEPDKKDE